MFRENVMNEEQKTLILADLMGWNVVLSEAKDEYHQFNNVDLRPYDFCDEGLSQFAEIILKFPSYVDKFHTETKTGMTSAFFDGWYQNNAPTQVNILDEILIINGIRIF